MNEIIRAARPDLGEDGREALAADLVRVEPTARPFTIDIPQDLLDDLQDRLARTRYAIAAPGDGWTYGTPVSYLRDMVEYWRTQFDWRAQEARMNEFPQYVTDVDGQRVHFVHVRSAVADATPLLLVHAC